ncbi:MAG: NADH-quinone oxidoreductase subunit L [Chitinophagales bacterium]|nr:NADH-quinone oxidoreductase subunit L [Chitinophagales bacterium]MDW8419639.1 NADH-quinone oxidoreductase subunit L [Chitinophagales bacterium]
MTVLLLIVLLPLAGFLLNAFWGKRLPKVVSGWLASAVVFVSFVLSAYYFAGFVSGTQTKIDADIYRWIQFGDLFIGFGFLLDQLSAIWLMVVTGIGFLIHVYSISYMHDDERFAQFFSYLNLFIFFMLLLVLGNNLLVTFIGWEGVGLCSYLLIGFWFKNQDYNNAAKKAFVMNRIGDLGFLFGMFILLTHTGTLHFSNLASIQPGVLPKWILVAVTALLFIGATGKSAQIPLYTWLPDAMAGPTPVSALIHAATMVTAGIYLVARTGFLYAQAPETLTAVASIGAATAILAATIGVFQNDIKKVLAYSTVSQLGLMFVALGVGAYVSAVFHVVTHAFFKACLFLGSGSVIHALHGEQDIRRMGGLKKYMPVTYWTFLISSLAISGIFPFSGFFSKDEILAAAFAHHKILWVIAMLTSLLTAFYMFRLLFLTFTGEFRGTEEQRHHLHESPPLITIPLIILSALATVGGVLGLPEFLGFHHWLKNFLSPVVAKSGAHAHALSHSTELALMGGALAGAIVSIAYSYILFVRGGALPVPEGEEKGITRLVYHKYYVDEIYEKIIVQPVMFLSDIAYRLLDRRVIDGLVNTSGRLSMIAGGQIRKLQTGYIGYYMMFMVLSLVAVFVYALLIRL